MSKIKHKGLSTYRFADNPEERRFAEAWQASNDQGRTLDHLLDPRKGEPFGPPPAVGDREREVAATIVQWLGSPVGQGFLRGLGYVRDGKSKPAPMTDADMLARERARIMKERAR